jgi:hypothetical protein
MLGRLRSIVLVWLMISALSYLVWQGPLASERFWSNHMTFIEVIYYFNLPGLMVHGPHGGYGDWRDPGIIIPSTGLFYAAVHFALDSGVRWARNRAHAS